MQGDTEVRCPPVGDEKDDDDYRRTRHYVSDDPSEVSLEIWMGESFGSAVSFLFVRAKMPRLPAGGSSGGPKPRSASLCFQAPGVLGSG